MACLPPGIAHTAGVILVLGFAACGWYQYPLPTPLSPNPVAPVTGLVAPGLKAGFGRADITPPPGVGLAGNGPEGRTSTGWRHRLYARALVLEDLRGERIALVVTDLPHVSPNLHRLAASRLVGETGIGADRLIVSATHTHSGPGHFYAERQYNDNGARLSGYDPAIVDFLVSGIVQAVRQAYHGRTLARAAWGFQTVYGFTRNRSYLAYCRNPDSLRPPCPPRTSFNLTRAVDPVWALLRIDRLDKDSVFRPAGAFSVFAIHGTANPSVTTLLDGDIHAVVERRLEWLIDSLNGGSHGFVNRSVHVFANSNQGDVSPNRDTATTQCPVPRLRAPEYAGPRGVAGPWHWKDADARELERCFRAARLFIDQTGRVMGDSAFAHFLRLGGAASLRSDITIARAFTTVRLPGLDGLCTAPVVGTSTVAGASDVPTRLADWKLFGLFPIGFEQGGSAISGTPEGCQERKRVLLGSAQQIATGEHGLADAAQLTVVRIGDVLVGAVPVEATITTGRLFREAILEGVNSTGRNSLATIVGLANGFVQYVTTKYEYAEQAYEGGSTLYGPRTQEVLANELRKLGQALARTAPTSPPAEVAPMMAYPGKPQSIMPRRTTPDTVTFDPVFLGRWCGKGGGFRLRWIDVPPGRMAPSAGQVLEIQELWAGSWVPFAWDDQNSVVVEGIGPRKIVVNGMKQKQDAFEWQVSVARPTAGDTMRLWVLPRPGIRTTGFDFNFPGCPPRPSQATQ